ncbi:MAG: hypothetical protein IJW26_05365 [Clostridia bacterium]|nr:hypothetical protein [Clostridia bacterium]
MKNLFKRLLVITMALLTCVSAFSCKKKQNSDDPNANVKNPYTFTLFNFGGGYGREWLDTLITRYKKERAGKEFVVDGVTYDGVDFDVDSEKTTMASMVSNKVSYDIWFQEQVFYNEYVRNGNVFEPITEALTTPNPYEDGVTLERKLTAQQKDFYKVDTNGDGTGDTYYGIPHYAGYVGIVYNKNLFETNGWYFRKNYDKSELETALDFCFTKDLTDRTPGPDGKANTDDDGLPTTYEEFFALCQKISSTNVPLSWAGKYRQEYLNWFITALTANYEGLEQMSLNYSFSGTAKNLISVSDSGVVTQLDDVQINGAQNGYELSKQAGKYYALSFLEKIADEGWHSEGAYSNTYEQTYAQSDFVKGTQDSSARPAMLIDGVWWEMEADGYFDEIQQGLGRNDKDRYGWMPLPCATEEQATTRANAIQNGGKGYTMMDTHNSLCFLGKGLSADAKKIAIDFIQFAYTDVSLAEFSTITDTTKAVTYSMDDTQKAKMSAFGRSVMDMQEKADIVYGFSNKTFYQLNESNFSDYKEMYNSSYTENSTTQKIAFDQFKEGISAKKYFDGLYIYNKQLWNSAAIVK